jgi:hypothetical protein
LKIKGLAIDVCSLREGGGFAEKRGDAMKYILLLPAAMVAIALHGQSSAVDPIHGARVNAELTKRIDAKKAKVGDTVEAKTTSAVKLPDGTELPKGTKLAGKVTDVRARSNSDKTSHIAFNLDEALMKDGREVPLRVIVMSATVPFDAPPDTSGMTGSSRGPATQSGGAGVSPTPTTTPGQYVQQSAMSNGMQSMPGETPGMVAHGPNQRVMVGNLPGVQLTSADGTSNSAALDATDKNIMLDSETKLTLFIGLKN